MHQIHPLHTRHIYSIIYSSKFNFSSKLHFDFDVLEPLNPFVWAKGQCSITKVITFELSVSIMWNLSVFKCILFNLDEMFMVNWISDLMDQKSVVKASIKYICYATCKYLCSLVRYGCNIQKYNMISITTNSTVFNILCDVS